MPEAYWSARPGQQEHTPAGCSKRLSSKAAASEEARRTLRYVEPLSGARTPLVDFLSILRVANIHGRIIDSKGCPMSKGLAHTIHDGGVRPSLCLLIASHVALARGSFTDIGPSFMLSRSPAS